jgi:DNA-binding CsgD family transcriptional regulator
MMEVLRAREVAVLMASLERVHRAPTSAECIPELFEALQILVPGAIFSFESVSRRTGVVSSHTSGVPEGDIESWRKRLKELVPRHPLYPHVARDPRLVMSISDLLSDREFQQTALYCDIMRPLDVKHQLVVGLKVPHHVAGMTINRDKEFTGGERALIQTIAPHLALAHSTHQTPAMLRATREMEYRPEIFGALGLTNREAEVVTWVVQGKRDQEIAQILGAATRTIQKHVQRIIAKLGVETRTAAAMEAIRRSAVAREERLQ